MMCRAQLLPRALGAAVLLFLVLPVPEAAAQFGRPTASRAPRPTEEAAKPPPPGLPGLQYRRAPEVIPADPNAQLSPTEALFDAINRGDLVTAKDSVTRGADLDATNVLGLRPEEAAVDQNRNDILFYLLSVRGLYRNSGPPEAAQTRTADRSNGRNPRNSRTARAGEESEDAPVPRGRRGQAPPASVTAERGAPLPSTASARNPRLWANDGGSAQPDVGFLGFDAGRGSGSPPARSRRDGG
jgi:hypothetical protein